MSEIKIAFVHFLHPSWHWPIVSEVFNDSVGKRLIVPVRFQGVHEVAQAFQLTMLSSLAALNEQVNELRATSGQDTYVPELPDHTDRAVAHSLNDSFYAGQAFMGFQWMLRDPELADFFELQAEHTVKAPMRISPELGDTRKERPNNGAQQVMSLWEVIRQPTLLFSQVTPAMAKKSFLGTLAKIKRAMLETDGDGRMTMVEDPAITPLPRTDVHTGANWVNHLAQKLFGDDDTDVREFQLNRDAGGS